jgi:hypothetical protein
LRGALESIGPRNSALFVLAALGGQGCDAIVGRAAIWTAGLAWTFLQLVEFDNHRPWRKHFGRRGGQARRCRVGGGWIILGDASLSSNNGFGIGFGAACGGLRRRLFSAAAFFNPRTKSRFLSPLSLESRSVGAGSESEWESDFCAAAIAEV